MKFQILKVKNRMFALTNFTRTKVTVKLEDGTILNVTSWPVNHDTFFLHVKWAIRDWLKKREEKLEAMPSHKLSQVLGHEFDTAKHYDETWFEIKNLEEEKS